MMYAIFVPRQVGVKLSLLQISYTDGLLQSHYAPLLFSLHSYSVQLQAVETESNTDSHSNVISTVVGADKVTLPKVFAPFSGCGVLKSGFRLYRR